MQTTTQVENIYAAAFTGLEQMLATVSFAHLAVRGSRAEDIGGGATSWSIDDSLSFTSAWSGFLLLVLP